MVARGHNAIGAAFNAAKRNPDTAFPPAHPYSANHRAKSRGAALSGDPTLPSRSSAEWLNPVTLSGAIRSGRGFDPACR